MIQTQSIRKAIEDERKAHEEFSAVKSLVAKVFKIKGQDVSNENLEFISEELCRKIKQQYKDLTITELSIIFDEGVYGMFGEYYSLNLVTFFAWISSYFVNYINVRSEAKINYKQLALPVPEKKLSDGDTKKLVLDTFQQFKNNNQYVYETGEHFGNIIYNIIERFNADAFTPKVKKEMWGKIEKNKEFYKKQITNKLKNNPLKNCFDIDKYTQQKMIEICKMELVIEYFNFCIFTNTDIF